MLIPPGLLRARRQLRRAHRLAPDRPTAALPLAQQACDRLCRQAARDPRHHDEYATSLTVVAELHLAVVDLGAALSALHALVALLEAPAAFQGRDAAAAEDRLADALTRRGDTHRRVAAYDRAQSDLDRALLLAPSPLVLAGAHNAAGILATDTGRYDTAEQHYRLAIDLVARVRGPDSPDLAAPLHNLAGLAHARRRYEDGEPHARLAVALRRRRHGENSVEVAADLTVLGALLAGQHRLDEAEKIFERTLATWTARRGPDHYEVAVALHALAAVHAERGLLPQSVREYRAALAIKRRVLGHTHPEVVVLTADVALALRPVPAWILDSSVWDS